MKIQPRGDRVLAKLEPEVKPAGKLIVSLRPSPVRIAKVLAVGPGKPLKKAGRAPMEVQVGDRVAFFKAVADTKQGTMLTHYLDDDEVLISQSDILCVVEGDAEFSL
jgi:co-chaperonin GroES (HSP10)